MSTGGSVTGEAVSLSLSLSVIHRAGDRHLVSGHPGLIRATARTAGCRVVCTCGTVHHARWVLETQVTRAICRRSSDSFGVVTPVEPWQGPSRAQCRIAGFRHACNTTKAACQYPAGQRLP